MSFHWWTFSDVWKSDILTRFSPLHFILFKKFHIKYKFQNKTKTFNDRYLSQQKHINFETFLYPHTASSLKVSNYHIQNSFIFESFLFWKLFKIEHHFNEHTHTHTYRTSKTRWIVNKNHVTYFSDIRVKLK